jgi:hypothetical protein
MVVKTVMVIEGDSGDDNGGGDGCEDCDGDGGDSGDDNGGDDGCEETSS